MCLSVSVTCVLSLQLRSIDLSNTAITGTLPASWNESTQASLILLCIWSKSVNKATQSHIVNAFENATCQCKVLLLSSQEFHTKCLKLCCICILNQKAGLY